MYIHLRVDTYELHVLESSYTVVTRNLDLQKTSGIINTYEVIVTAVNLDENT